MGKYKILLKEIRTAHKELAGYHLEFYDNYNPENYNRPLYLSDWIWKCCVSNWNLEDGDTEFDEFGLVKLFAIRRDCQCIRVNSIRFYLEKKFPEIKEINLTDQDKSV